MDRRWLPLSALRAFEAAARHSSFVRAAEELGVTKSAVSRQIAELERFLGGALFVRKSHRVMPTPTARQLQGRLTDCLNEMTRAIDESVVTLRAEIAVQARLAVRVVPTLAIRIILPRLAHFERDHPNISIQISAAESELSGTPFDLVVDYARDLPEFGRNVLFRERVVPVSSPTYLASLDMSALRLNSSLAGVRLLTSTPDAWDWHRWSVATRIALPVTATAMHFETDELALRSATAGLGVALAEQSFVQCDLLSGSLCLLWPEVSEVELGFYYLDISRTGDTEAADLFVDWITHELALLAELEASE